MKNIFRKSVQIFKDKKDKDGVYVNSSGNNGGINENSNQNGSNKSSPTSSMSKKDKKNKHNVEYNQQQQQDINSNSSGNYNNSSISSNGSGIYNQYYQHQQQQYHNNNISPTLTREDSISSYNSDSTTISAASSPPIFIYNPNARKVFGVPLSQVPCRMGSNVPIIIEKLVDHIERTSLTTEGLFRIPGRDVTINQYINLFNNGEDVDVSPIEPYTAAGLLKRFFRDLPVFVPQSINKRVASLFVSEDGKKKQVDMEILANLRVLVHQLPTVHFEVMQALTGLLAKIMSKSDENKMTISNIAICLVPTLNCIPAIVTYPIQYYDFFFNEIFPEHHLYHMRPYQTNLITTAIEERLEQISHLSTQPMLIPGSNNNNNNNNGDVQKRYSRPASITISSLLPNQNQNSPSSSTITSTITSPHDVTAPITFTVTTTFSQDQNQQSGSPSQHTNISDTASQSSVSTNTTTNNNNGNVGTSTTSSNRDRRTYKIDPNEYAQFLEETQYNINRNYLYGGKEPTNNNNTLNSSTNNISPSTTISNNNNNNNSYRRSVAYSSNPLNSSTNIINNNPTTTTTTTTTGSTTNTNSLAETKAAIQQIKEKIDRYSKEKKSREDKEREKLLRYSIDLERYKDRYNKEKRSSRDINREIEREIEKRLSPRERLNLLLASGVGSNNNGTFNLSSSVNSTLNSNNRSSISGISSLLNGAGANNNVFNDTSSTASGSTTRDRRISITQQLQMQLQQLQQQQLIYQQQQQSTTPIGSNTYLNNGNGTNTTTTTTSSNRYSSNRYKPVSDLASSSSSFRYSREIYDDEYYSNNNMMMFNGSSDQQQPSNNSISTSSSSAFSRQRSQSCFEPESLIQQLSLQQQQQQSYQQQQQQQTYQTPFQSNPQYSNAFIEQKLDQIRDTINNLHRDNRVSRDYTHYLREVEDLRSSLQKETVTTEFFANKNQELEDKLRREEEKNKRLAEEIHLFETYFILKEKSKLSKRLSTTKDILTRSRSPTLPNNMMNNNGPSLNSSSNSIHLNVPNQL